MARNEFKRLEWLMHLLAERPRSLSEIFRAYEEDRNINPEGRAFVRKTFYNHRDALEEIFAVRLLKDPLGRYYLSESGKEVSRRLSDLHIRRITNEYSTIAGRIWYQQDRRAPLGREREPEKVRQLCEAMSGNRKVSFQYKKKNGTEYEPRKVRPYFLRMDEQRSYLVGYCEKGRGVRTFCIDQRLRHGSIKILEETFSFPDPAAPYCTSPDEYFKDAPGVVTASKECPPCDIIIRVTVSEAENLRAVHLFEPQEELTGYRGPHGEVEFRYHLAPTTEFFQRLFWHLESAVVIDPLPVVDKAREYLKMMQENYLKVRDEIAERQLRS